LTALTTILAPWRFLTKLVERFLASACRLR
jgi:hypothetical protein